MKSRIILATFTLLVFASANTAFKPKETNSKLAGAWFEYIGPQSPSCPASLANARIPLNYQLSNGAMPTTGSGYLKAIFVQQSEIDDNGTIDPSDDLPRVNATSGDGYTALLLAKDPITGQWSNVTYNTAIVDDNSEPY